MDANGLSGGLVLFWNGTLNISSLSYSLGHIDWFINYVTRY